MTELPSAWRGRRAAPALGDGLLIERPRLLSLMGEPTPGEVTLVTAPAGSGKTVMVEQWLAAHDGRVLHVEGSTSVDLLDLTDPPPADVHLVITGRARWRTGLRRLQQRDVPVRVVDESDLAFTADEVRTLARDIAGCDLTDNEIQLFLARTGGWALALQMLALELRGPDGAQGVVEACDGRDRRLVAFFDREVLARQSERMGRFLLETSVLDEMSGERCRAVTGEPSSALLLRLLEDHGDFVHRVEAGADRFVYHPLFRDVLRNQLRVSQPGAERLLLLRAARWHDERAEAAPAIPYLVQAEAWDELIELVNRNGRRLFEASTPDVALDWLSKVPASWRRDRNGQAIRLAYLHTMVGQTRVAQQIVHDVGVRDLAQGEMAVMTALRATWVFVDGQPQAVLSAADETLAALEQIEDQDIPDILGITSRASLTAMAVGSRARAHWSLGEIAGARAELESLSREPGIYQPWQLHTISTLALLEAWSGNFNAAKQHARRALRDAAASGLSEHPALIDSYHALAHIRRERGAEGGARILLHSGLVIARGTRRPVALAVNAIERSLCALASGQAARGLADIREVRVSGEPRLPPLVEARLRAAEVRLLLAIGDGDQAGSMVRDREPELARFSELSAVAVQLAVADGDFPAARAELRGWVPEDGSPRARLEHELWTAVVDLETGSRRDALARGADLLAAAEPEGHMRLFLDAGRPAERLLNALVNADGSPYAQAVLRSGELLASQSASSALLGLTAREVAVARFLPTTLSSAEIAAQLFISRNTLKTHLQTIYRKLGVSGRHEAIRRAQELGLA